MVSVAEQRGAVRARGSVESGAGAGLQRDEPDAMSGAATPTAAEPPALDERDVEPRTPMKRLGSTRKLAAFNSMFNLHYSQCQLVPML